MLLTVLYGAVQPLQGRGRPGSSAQLSTAGPGRGIKWISEWARSSSRDKRSKAHYEDVLFSLSKKKGPRVHKAAESPSTPRVQGLNSHLACQSNGTCVAKCGATGWGSSLVTSKFLLSSSSSPQSATIPLDFFLLQLCSQTACG